MYSLQIYSDLTRW